MDALVAREVKGKLSAVVGMPLLRAQPQDAGGKDLADLGQALGGGHEVGGKGVGGHSVSSILRRIAVALHATTLLPDETHVGRAEWDNAGDEPTCRSGDV